MIEKKDIYFKQKALFNPHDRANQRKIIVYGAGSIGSHVVVGLAKCGFKDITVIDFDTIEESNLPAQFYNQTQSHVESMKVSSLYNMVKTMVGNEIIPIQDKITEKSNLNIQNGTIHILAFDNIEGRKIVLDKLKDYPVHLIDGRIGGFNIEKYYINMLDENTYREYAKTLEGEFSELECGEKALWSVNSLIASKIIADVIKLTKGIKPTYEYKTNILDDLAIVRKEVK